ncbi:MAG: MliC family protein [Candidatus Pacebacteria bacterium]|nr:MliC family protein [Candidatus Paceibacterota bacterium]
MCLIVFIIFFASFFLIAFLSGMKYENCAALKQNSTNNEGVIASANFACANNKTILAIFMDDSVHLTLSDGRNLNLMRTVSGSGARYANTDESIVFWNVGDTASLDENNQTTYNDCAVQPGQ